MRLFVYLYTTVAISVGCCRLWITEMGETNNINNIKGLSLKTYMANLRNVQNSVALASQAGKYNFSFQLRKIYNKLLAEMQ